MGKGKERSIESTVEKAKPDYDFYYDSEIDDEVSETWINIYLKEDNTMKIMYTVMDYAKEIASKVNGEVKVVDKPNGVQKVGIQLPMAENNTAPIVYVDEMFNEGRSIDSIIKYINDNVDKGNYNRTFNIDFLDDFEQVKERLGAKLYNINTSAEVFRNATEYGFDDLIIVPYVLVEKDTDGQATIKVTKDLLERWNVTADEVIDIALEREKANMKVMSMLDTLKEMGLPVDELPPLPEEDQQIIVTNKLKVNGAISVLFAKEKLAEYFPNGYIIMPSSIHEVIAVAYDENVEPYTEMVREVNATQVAPEEQLSDHAYVFAGR